MKIEVREIKSEPPPPPTWEYVLTLTAGEANILRAIASWHETIPDAIHAKGGTYVSKQDMSDFLHRLWFDLFGSPR